MHSFCILFTVLFFFAVKNFGFGDSFLKNWIFGSGMYAFIIAFPMAYFLPPYVSRFIQSFIEE